MWRNAFLLFDRDLGMRVWKEHLLKREPSQGD